MSMGQKLELNMNCVIVSLNLCASFHSDCKVKLSLHCLLCFYPLSWKWVPKWVFSSCLRLWWATLGKPLGFKSAVCKPIARNVKIALNMHTNFNSDGLIIKGEFAFSCPFQKWLKQVLTYGKLNCVLNVFVTFQFNIYLKIEIQTGDCTKNLTSICWQLGSLLAICFYESGTYIEHNMKSFSTTIKTGNIGYDFHHSLKESY